MSSCRHVTPLLEPYVDGEISTDKMIEVEQHVTGCPCCLERVRLATAIKTSTRDAVRGEVTITPGFQARVLHALAAESDRASARAAEANAHGYLSWRSIVPVAAAAAATLVWAASVEDRPSGYSNPLPNASASLTDGADQLIDEFVRHHATGGDAASPAVDEPSLIGQLEPEVGVPVHAPSLSEYGASWEGGSVVRVSARGQRAAVLRYRLGSHRVSVYVYDAGRYPLRARLEPRVVRDVPVYVGQRRGYSIAATERRGVGYAAAADLDDESTAELVAAAYR